MRLDTMQAESLHDELARLRKNEGFIQRRLASSSIADQVLRQADTDTFERLKSRFISAIYSLSEPESALLLDIYALSPETEGVASLKERRQIHGQKIHRKIEAVAMREKPALDHLHSRLVAGTYAQSPLVLHVPEMHGGLIYEHVSVLIVVENRIWRETREYYRFANMVDELDYVTISRSYPALATPHPKGDFKVNTRPVEGVGWNDHFWHLDKTHAKTEPMLQDQIYDLRFTLVPELSQAEPTPITLASRALHERALLFSLQVGFIGEKPKRLWKFERVSPFARPDTANQYNQIALDEHGIATVRLRDVYGGLFNGIGWEW